MSRNQRCARSVGFVGPGRVWETACTGAKRDYCVQKQDAALWPAHAGCGRRRQRRSPRWVLIEMGFDLT